MIIKSNFKDYYDFVPHQFGGGDPNIIYNRVRLNSLAQMHGSLYDEGIKMKDEYNIPSLPYNTRPFVEGLKFKWLVVTGKLYLLVAKNTFKNEEYEVFNQVKHTKGVYEDDSFESLFEKKPKNKNLNDYYIGLKLKKLIDLSKKINAPVFCIRSVSYRDIVIDGSIPVLSNLGIASIINPTQIYQDIAYFVANTMHANPDISPPVEIGEKDRIVSHGFDLKQSFRHRK